MDTEAPVTRDRGGQQPEHDHQAPQPPSRRRRRYAPWIWLLVLSGAAYGAWRIYGNLQQSKQKAAAAQARSAIPRAVPVSAVPARTGDLPVFLRGLGTVDALNTVVVKPRVEGQLMAIHFSEGQFVKKGQLLAEIDPRPFQVQLQQAEGQLAKDMAQLNDARANLARYQALWDEKVIAKQQLDSQAALVGQYEGIIESDRAAIANARLQLTYAKVTAPLSGRIGLRAVDVGNIVSGADPNGIATIAQMQPIAVLFTIPADNLQSVLRKLRAGAKLPVYAYDRDDKTRIASGTLLTVDNQIDPQTGTSKLKAVFPNADLSLFPNQFVNCRLLMETRRGVTLVPAPAVQRGPQGPFVFVAENGIARTRPVQVAFTEGGEASAQGVRPGELVITEGQDKLEDGGKVEVRGIGGGRTGGEAKPAAKGAHP